MAKKSSDRTKIQDLGNQLKRALADYANLQKRVEQERSNVVDFARAAVITRFLSTLDNLESIEKQAKDQGDALAQGIEIVVKEMKKVFEEEGVEEVNTTGHFDPLLHDPVAVVKGKSDGQIVEVVAKGYRLGEKVLRPARVKVAKKES